MKEKEIILKKISSFSQSKQYKEKLNPKLLEEVVNIVEDPNLLHVSFSKRLSRNTKRNYNLYFRETSKIFSNF